MSVKKENAIISRDYIYQMNKLSTSKPLLQSCLNFVIAWTVGYFLDVITSKFFNFDLNQFYSVEHFAIGIFIGTFFYLIGRRGIRGVFLGLIAGTFSICRGKLLKMV